jgi:hypothetical protein
MTPKRTATTRSMTRRYAAAPLAAAPAGVPLGAPAAGESTLDIEGFIVIQIGDEKFTLTGKIGDAIIVSYHKPFEEALPLGTLTQMIGKVATALGIPNAAGFEQSLNTTLDDVAKVPVLGPVVKMLKEGVFKITDLGINTQTKTYEFGFGVDTTATVNNIPIAAFGMKFTYVSAPAQ